MEFYALSVNFLEKLPAQGGIFLFSAFSALPLPLSLSLCTLLSPWPFNKSTAVFRPIPPFPHFLPGFVRLVGSRKVRGRLTLARSQLRHWRLHQKESAALAQSEKQNICLYNVVYRFPYAKDKQQ